MTSIDDTFSIELTPQELLFLSSVLGLPGTGIDESWQLTEESDPLSTLQSVRRNLNAKAFIRWTDDEHALGIDQSVAMIVSVVGHPAWELDVSLFDLSTVEPKQLRLLGARGLIIEQGAGSNWSKSLTACRNTDVALQRLFNFLGLTDQPPSFDEAIGIKAEEMAELSYVVAGDGPEAGAIYLIERGVAARAAERLALAFNTPIRHSVLRACIWIDGEPVEVYRLTLLEDPFGLWLVTGNVVDETEATARPVSATEACDAIRELSHATMYASRQ